MIATALARLDPLRLFVDVEGRIARGPYWIAVLCLVGVDLALVWLGSAAAVETETGVETSVAVEALRRVVRLAMIWPGLAVAVKRLHDCGHGAGLAVADALFGLLYEGLDMAGLARGRDSGDAFGVLLTAGALLSIAFTLYLGVRPGEAGPNRFGPPPGPLT